MNITIKAWLAALLALLGAEAASAETARVAVAANFAEPMQEIARLFAATGHQASPSIGSTGQFYAQIRNGAPFDVLLAADRATPEKLEGEGHAVAGTRFTYALGKLALYARDARVSGPEALNGAYRKLAIANPELAPYGAAAREALLVLKQWDAVRSKLVLGQNIAQAFQFVATGNAELGFVALAQITGKPGSRWVVPQDLYAPIGQDAVLLKRGADNAAARAFLEFLRTDKVRDAIAAYGYGVE